MSRYGGLTREQANVVTELLANETMVHLAQALVVERERTALLEARITELEAREPTVVDCTVTEYAEMLQLAWSAGAAQADAANGTPVRIPRARKPLPAPLQTVVTQMYCAGVRAVGGTVYDPWDRNR